MTYAIMDDAVIPYTLPEVKDHSFFFISQHIAPSLEAKMHRHEAWELYFVTHGNGVRMTGDTLMPFAEGDVVLIPPSMPHYWEYKPESANDDGEVTYSDGGIQPGTYKIFNKETGLSPTKYRKQAKKMS